MKIVLFAAAFACALAPLASASSCRSSDVPSILAQVRQTEDQGEVLGRFASRELCFAESGDRLRRGQQDEGKHLACVTRQTVLGAYYTELKGLDNKIADGLCLRINACLFDRFDRGRTDPANLSLGHAWDRLSCDGE